jgi:predicted RNase H-like HicB family nuclease
LGWTLTKQLTYTVAEEDDLFIARCIELDISSDGLTSEEAIENLKEALDCYFANPDQRLDQVLGDTWENE